MRKKQRKRGQHIRYIKNPSKAFFTRIEPYAEYRATEPHKGAKGKKKNRKPKFPKSTIPEENQSKYDPTA